MKYINEFNINRREKNFDNSKNLRACNNLIKKELTFILNETSPVDVVM